MAINSFASKAKDEVKTITVADAFNQVESKLKGNTSAIAKAQKQINECAIGGMTITQREFDRIINTLTKSSQPAKASQQSKSETESDRALAEALAQEWGTLPPASAAAAAPSSQYKSGQEAKKQVTAQEGTKLVPAELQGKVTYIKTDLQGTDECGSRAVFFAKIISESPEDQINSKIINEKMKKFKAQLCQASIDDVQVAALAVTESIKNFYVIQYDHSNDQLLIMQRTQNSPNDINEIIARLLGNDNERAFFVVNTGNHWVLIAVIKSPGKAPKIFYLNSLNGPLSKDSRMSAYYPLKALVQSLGL